MRACRGALGWRGELESIRIEASERTPEVDFNFEVGEFALRGESYPEDAARFYGPLLDRLQPYLGALAGGAVRFEFELAYFNSSSAKVLLGLFDALEAAAAAGADVTIDWICGAGNELMADFGTEFAEDLRHAKFNLTTLAC